MGWHCWGTFLWIFRWRSSSAGSICSVGKPIPNNISHRCTPLIHAASSKEITGGGDLDGDQYLLIWEGYRLSTPLQIWMCLHQYLDIDRNGRKGWVADRLNAHALQRICNTWAAMLFPCLESCATNGENKEQGRSNFYAVCVVHFLDAHAPMDALTVLALFPFVLLPISSNIHRQFAKAWKWKETAAQAVAQSGFRSNLDMQQIF